ncbi:MAG TPA: amidophosphoribosyltransferase [Gemmatales bacterium]|nr:amidophosphoribosyltransferase [Gemmatales bacterium]
MEDLQHECGVAAIYLLDRPGTSTIIPDGSPETVAKLLPRMLLDLQNRGQLAAGMTSFHPHREKLLDTHKEIGTVIEAFRLNHRGKAQSILRNFAGQAAIGHVRYATCGKDSRSYAQPFNRYHGNRWKWFSFAFNGQLANYHDLKEELLARRDYHLTRDTDTEVMMHLLSYELRGEQCPDLVEVFRNLGASFDGAYNIVFLNARGDMVVSRDPRGIRPLCYAVDGPLLGAASESVALQNVGFKEIRDLEPGTMLLVENGQWRIERYAPPLPPKHCFFEWIYFANVASTLDGHSVYLSRSRLGRELAAQEQAEGLVAIDSDTIVVPVPDTAKAAADAMAHELQIPSVEGLMRNRYVGRTFIEGDQRLDRARMKYTPLREVLRGKRVLLVEDTIVRSTTMQTLVKLIRDVGRARELHVRVACPPIVAPCFYGIDMSTLGELFAPKYQAGDHITVEEQQRMARDLGADSLRYLPVESIARCIGLPAQHICQACIGGEYPTPKGQELFQLALRRRHQSATRTYEAEVPVRTC